MDSDKTLNANSCGLNPEILMVALLKSGLHWKMHPAQLFALFKLELKNVTVLETECKEILPELKHKYTLLGIPVVIDLEQSKYKVDLCSEYEVEYRIDGLAVPMEFF
jgi:hypothetical protein